MTPQQFIAKWREAQLSERSAYQQHFCDLCDLLGQPKPADADRDGAWYTFERGVTKTDGENGWADVCMQGHFGWEYKGKRKNLKEAYKQPLQYREDLEYRSTWKHCAGCSPSPMPSSRPHRRRITVAAVGAEL